MDGLILVYNAMLLILYGIVFFLSCLLWIKTKRNLYLYTGILFLFYIFDNLVIYTTELIESFSLFYDSIFMSVPTFKTIIFVVTFLCVIKINALVLHREQDYFFEVLLVLLSVYLLFIPMMQDSALKVWLYYFPCQVFTFLLGLYGLNVLKKESGTFDPEVYGHYRKLLVWTVVFSVLIVIEDTIVIFNFDIYSDILVKINNRSVSEDIMSIGYSIYAIVFYVRMINVTPDKSIGNVVPDGMPGSPTVSADEDIMACPASGREQEGGTDALEPVASDPEEYSKFYLFCRKYQLTAREQDILLQMLKNKNNQEISDILVISLGTVKTHTHNIFQKLGVTKRRQLLELYEGYMPDEEEGSPEQP